MSINSVFYREGVSAKNPAIDYQTCKDIIETVVNDINIFKPMDVHLKKIVAFSNFFTIAKKAALVGTYACSVLNISLTE